MNRDVEIEQVMRRMLAAIERADAEAFLDLWHPEIATAIGSDAGEWFVGRGEIDPIIREQFRLVGPITIEVGDVLAWSQDDVGWAALRGSFGMEGIGEITVRGTCVVVLHRGSWRLTHSHMSYAVPNEAALGMELPTTLEQVLQGVIEDRPDLAHLAAESGEVTLLFTDIERSTELAAEYGDQRWFELLHLHDAALDRALHGCSGQLVKSIGDGSMFAFPSPQDCVTFVRAARRGLATVDALRPLRVRMGAHCGEAIKHGDDFFGTTVNFAARVAGAAAGDQTLVSDALRLRLDDGAVVPAGRFELKGIPGEHPLHELR